MKRRGALVAPASRVAGSNCQLYGFGDRELIAGEVGWDTNSQIWEPVTSGWPPISQTSREPAKRHRVPSNLNARKRQLGGVSFERAPAARLSTLSHCPKADLPDVRSEPEWSSKPEYLSSALRQNTPFDRRRFELFHRQTPPFLRFLTRGGLTLSDRPQFRRRTAAIFGT